MTRKEFSAVMTYIGTAVGKPLAPEAIEVYFDLLGDLALDQLQAGAKRVLLEHKWTSFPTVAELRAAAAEVRICELSPAEAWRLAWQAAGRIDLEVDGSIERATRNLPPVVVEAMNSFGIAAMTGGHEPVGVVRAQFIKIFEQLSARDHRKALLPPKLKKEIESIGQRHELPPAVAGMIEGIAKVG